jgi:MinD-like ATPase involved in chromosome partitioning or flagellar assembly
LNRSPEVRTEGGRILIGSGGDAFVVESTDEFVVAPSMVHVLRNRPDIAPQFRCRIYRVETEQLATHLLIDVLVPEFEALVPFEGATDAAGTSESIERDINRMDEASSNQRAPESTRTRSLISQRNVVAVVSPPGVGSAGKSFVAVNIAVALGRLSGGDVALVDFADGASVQKLVSDSSAAEGLVDQDALANIRSLGTIGQRGIWGCHPTFVARDERELGDLAHRLLRRAGDDFAWVVVDTPGGYTSTSLLAVDVSSTVLLIAGLADIRAVAKSLESLATVGIPDNQVKVLFNRSATGLPMLRIDALVPLYGHADSEALVVLSDPTSPTAQALIKIASFIHEDEWPPPSREESNRPDEMSFESRREPVSQLPASQPPSLESVLSAGSSRDWANDAAGQDALVQAPSVMPREFDPRIGYILLPPTGGAGVDAAVLILSSSIERLPRDWRSLTVKAVDGPGVDGSTTVDVTCDDRSRISKRFEGSQLAETMMPGDLWLGQHGFVIAERTANVLRAHHSGVPTAPAPVRPSAFEENGRGVAPALGRMPSQLLTRWSRFPSLSESERIRLAKDLNAWGGSKEPPVRSALFWGFVDAAADDADRVTRQKYPQHPDRNGIGHTVIVGGLEEYLGGFRNKLSVEQYARGISVWDAYKGVTALRDKWIETQTGEADSSGLAKLKKKSFWDFLGRLPLLIRIPLALIMVVGVILLPVVGIAILFGLIAGGLNLLHGSAHSAGVAIVASVAVVWFVAARVHDYRRHGVFWYTSRMQRRDRLPR